MTTTRSDLPFEQRAGIYDETRCADPGLVERLVRLLRPEDGRSYLDLACGTGTYTTALSERAGCWYGVDHSPRMLRRAMQKSGRIVWLLGNAESLPFADRSLACAVCTLAIHCFDRLTAVFREVRRVLDGGVFVLFTTGHDQMRTYWLNEYFPVAMKRSIEQMPSLDLVEASLRSGGFRDVRTEPFEVTPDLKDLFLYAGKQRPELYLSEGVRRGIGTFADLTDPEELASGLARLRADIESGAIRSVIDRYERTGGDYSFVIGS